MTFQKVKEELVGKEILTNKELKKLLLNLTLFILGVVLCISLATYAVLGFGFTVLIMILALVAFITVFDIAVESVTALKRIIRVTRLWIIPYLCMIAVWFVLKLFNFV